MSETTSPRLALPLLYPGQAHKELFHNEALLRIDAACGAVAVAAGLDTPPASPAEGQCWIVGDTPAGAWAGQARALACWTAGGWRFVAAFEGMAVWCLADAATLRHAGGAWAVGPASASELRVGGLRVVGARRSAIADPVGGATADSQVRAVVATILATMRAHGLIAT